MFFLLNKGIFHCYVSLPEGIIFLFDRLSAQSKKKRDLEPSLKRRRFMAEEAGFAAVSGEMRFYGQKH